ncbi:MAG: TIGR04348 family glycosyltransferase [Polaromonas sp.]|nr:TIGR04348 family glycosyltransferase [Polaromonas sp.]
MRGESIIPEVEVADAEGVESEAKIFKPVKAVLVSPSMAGANNGNWHTAHRWAQFLSGYCDIALLQNWAPPANMTQSAPQVMIALHARRSAASIHAWAAAWPRKPLIVVLTGTDLYRDIHTDPDAQRSLALATHLVVLQEAGLAALPQVWRNKTTVIYQSAATLRPALKPHRKFRALMVGHLRDEKDPLTFMRAAAQNRQTHIYYDQIGSDLDAGIASAARSTARLAPNYRWLGGLPRAATRQHIKRAHVLVNCSKMEGGAHVILEAVQSGTPVLASNIVGNIGMLGAGYGGYFELGNDAQLAALVKRCAAEPDFLALLQNQCAQRARLFTPGLEKRNVINLVRSAMSLPQDS